MRFPFPIRLLIALSRAIINDLAMNTLSTLQASGFRILVLILLGLCAERATGQRLAPVDFGTLPCGSTLCDTVRFPSANPGEQIVAIGLLKGEAFLQSPALTLPLAIPDGDAIDLPLCFTPAFYGPSVDTLYLVVTDTATAEPDTVLVELRGNASGPKLTITPPILLFPRIDTGATAMRQIVIRNDGDAPQQILLSDLGGIAPPFRLIDSSGLPATIVPGDSIILSVEFAPTAQGSHTLFTDLPIGCDSLHRLHLIGVTTRLLERGFGQVACDEQVCDTLWVHGEGPNDRITSIAMRDSLSFTVSVSAALPLPVPQGDSIGIPVCFSPVRRGNIIDSLVIVVQRGGLDEPIRTRLSGTGIGPNIEIAPLVLNFPRTTAPATSQLTTQLINSGERTMVLTAADLPIPPPFRLVTPTPITINPGDTVMVDIAFEPTERGIFSVPVDVKVGCTRVLQVGLNGSTNFIGTGGVLRVTKVGFNPANDERVACDFSQCTDLVLSNVGNATLRVDQLNWDNGTLGYTFIPPPPTPFSIEPNESRTLQVCINAQRSGVLRDTLNIHSNDRRSIAFGVVLDISRSMDTLLRCGANSPTRLEEARRQAQTFIDNTLLHLPALNIQDQIAVILYSGTARAPLEAVVMETHPLTYIDDATRVQARAAVTASNSIGGTWTGAALLEMIETLRGSPLADRVIVLLTDGVPSTGDLLENLPADIIRAANDAGVRIFAIGLGLYDPNGIDYINDLTVATRGSSFLANDCGSLGDAFAEITEIVSQGGIWREPFQITVSAPKLLADNIRFDSTYIFDDTCMTLTLTNVGEGMAVVTDVQFSDLLGGATNEFYLMGGTTFPIRITENGQKDVTVCFRPEKLRVREGALRGIYNDCFDENAAGTVSGIGYAIANLRATDERMALPGQNVTIPVYGDTTLAIYEVNTITWTMRWNRTMLDFKGVRPGAQANGATVITTGPVVENGGYATIDLQATGPALYTPGELALFDFEFLRGDTLASYVEITTGTFEDGNPRTLLKNAGVVIYDSTCFRELRPIEYVGPAPKFSIGLVAPLPASGDRVDLTIEATGALDLHVDLFDAAGRSLVPSQRIDVTEGGSLLTLDVGELPSGIYYVRVRDEKGTAAYRTVEIRR